MDTVEELGGTYFFNGLSNLSATELYFWILLDEAGKQLGVDDLATLALIILGQPIKGTRSNPIGATKGTSYLSYYLRQWLRVEVKSWPTLTTGSIKRRAFIILCHVKKSLQRNHFIEAAFKINRQLGQCQIPALNRHCPFFLRVH